MSRQFRLAGMRVFFAVLLAGMSFAADKPNFTGEWKMDPGKSDYGAMDTPSKLTRKIEHQEPKIHMVTNQSGSRGELRMEFNYATDGKEYTNATRLGDAKSTLQWEGDTLVVTTKRSVMGRDLLIVDRCTLAADGKTMVIAGKISGGMGDNEYKVTFEKQ